MEDAQNLNQRIATVLGWRSVYWSEHSLCLIGFPPGDADTDFRNEAVLENPQAPGPTYYEVPNWAGSLDVMRNLEGALSEHERPAYVEGLRKILMLALAYVEYEDGLAISALYQENIFGLLHATAAQKAEAWLNVKEKT